jgi:hypothetical protein
VDFWDVILFYCNQQIPQANEIWLVENCSSDVHTRTITPANADVKYENRAPKDSDLPQVAEGWYMGCMNFFANDTHSGQTQTQQYGFYFTTAVYCEFGSCLRPAPPPLTPV